MAIPRIHRVHLEQNVGPTSEVLLLNNELKIQREAKMTNVLGTLYDIIIFYQSYRCFTDLCDRFSKLLSKWILPSVNLVLLISYCIRHFIRVLIFKCPPLCHKRIIEDIEAFCLKTACWNNLAKHGDPVISSVALL